MRQQQPNWLLLVRFQLFALRENLNSSSLREGSSVGRAMVVKTHLVWMLTAINPKLLVVSSSLTLPTHRWFSNSHMFWVHKRPSSFAEVV